MVLAVAVTGADGFLGRAVCASLGARGLRCVPLDRARTGDLAAVAPDRIVQGVAGCDVVVHLAGRAHLPASAGVAAQAALVRDNVDAARAVAHAARRAGVPRFLLASSVKVNGERTAPGRPFRTDDAPAPVDAYARSKLAGEQAVQAALAGSGTALAVLRLPLVYGAGAPANFARLVAAVRARRWLPLGAVRNARHLLGLHNLTSALARLGTAPEPVVGTYFIADREPVSTPALVRAIAAALGLAPRLAPVPVPLLRAAGALMGRSAIVDRLTQSLEVDLDPLVGALGWRPEPFRVDAAMLAA